MAVVHKFNLLPTITVCVCVCVCVCKHQVHVLSLVVSGSTPVLSSLSHPYSLTSILSSLLCLSQALSTSVTSFFLSISLFHGEVVPSLALLLSRVHS